MSRYDLVINDASYTVEIAEISAGRATVSVNGVPYQVELPGAAAPSPAVSAAPRTAAAPAAPAPVQRSPAPPTPAPAPAPAGSEAIAAPMPGHILGVAVKPGDPVEVGDTVVLMEAMKMENEIRSHLAGTVVEVKVEKGQDVGVGEVLVVIGP
ncbi:MAG: biotin/lipoyl-containing protein [Deferrisomatales bacterium]